jgi:hypothetical protein
MDRELRVFTRFGCVLIAIVAMSGSAYALSPQESDGLILHSTLGAIAEDNSSAAVTATEVKPGETLSIVGDCVMPLHSAENVRVVLTLTDSLASVEPGFRSVLATDQEVRGNALQVRVPDLPEAANRTFQVRVFRLGEQAPEVCDAGAIRIGGQAGGKVG